MRMMSEMLIEFKKLNLTKILILAVFIRILIIPFYFHPDIKTYHFQASFLKTGVFDIYSYLEANKERLPLKEEFVYFPLTYFVLGGYQAAITPLLGDSFQPWLADASQVTNERTGVYRFLFLLKLPYLILDISIAFLMLKFFKDENQRKKAFIFWLFNPFSIILLYIFSNVDIIPVFLTVASLVAVKRNKPILSALLLGLAAGFKAYPLLLIPFLFLYGKNIREKALILGVSLGTFLLTILPFLPQESFRQAALLSGLTTRLLIGSVSIGFGESLILGVILLSGLFFYGLQQRKVSFDNLIKYYFSAFILLYAFIHFHTQWLLWIMPPAVILLNKKKNIVLPLVLLGLVAFAIPVLYEDKFMSFALLTAISPLYNLLPLPTAVIQKVYDPHIIQSILHSTFVGGGLVVIWQLLSRSEGKIE